jgi:hypothetical protein
MPKPEYCEKCKRIIGIGCACNMTFKEKIESQILSLPDSFKATKDNRRNK